MTRKPAGSNLPHIIILGASSAIAEAAARTWANQGAHLLLAGRGAARLDAVAADLRTRGAVVDTVVVDLAVVEAKQALAEMIRRLGSVDVVLVAYGLLVTKSLPNRTRLRRNDYLPRTSRVRRGGVLLLRTSSKNSVTGLWSSSGLLPGTVGAHRTMSTEPPRPVLVFSCRASRIVLHVREHALF